VVINEKKLARQKELFFVEWKTAIKQSPVRAAIIEAVTGFGKTYTAILGIKDMNERHPDRTTTVVVPTTKLKEDWEGYWGKDDKGKKTWIPGHIEKHNLLNVRVFVVNTYTRYSKWECDFLILDEAHHYAGQESKYFSTVISITKYKWGLALSATLNDKQKEFFNKLGWLMAGTVTVDEAEKEGYVSRSIIYNLGIELSEQDKAYIEEINTKFKNLFSIFDFNFDIVRACNTPDARSFPINGLGVKTGKEWREWFAAKKGYRGENPESLYSPKNIRKNAALTMQQMGKRKSELYNSPSKLIYIKQLINKFKQMKTITFSQSSDMADKITALFPGRAVSYHTNLKAIAVKDDLIVTDVTDKKALKKEGFTLKGLTVQKREALQAFEDPNSPIRVLNTVRALDEGFDVEKIELVVQVAYNSTERQDKQRNGRGTRIDYSNLSKKTIIVNLYMIGTQEEKWLKLKQLNTGRVNWVTSVDQISLQLKVSLAA
jgi:superfamily II DNA or RNA helicase